MLFSFSVISAAGAQTPDGDRNVTRELRQVDAFHSVSLGGMLQAVFIQGDLQKVEVETEASQQQEVVLQVKDGVLEIKAQKIRDPRGMKVYIAHPGLKGIKAFGAAELKSQGTLQSDQLSIDASGASEAKLVLNVSSLDLSMEGAASAELSGSASTLTASVGGAADLNAGGLKVSTATVRASGAGSATLDVTDELNADISGAADLDLKAEPARKNIKKSGAAAAAELGDMPRNVKVVTRTRGDSTMVKLGDLDIRVVEGDDSTTVEVGGTRIEISEDGNVAFARERKHRFDGHWGGFYLGINGFMDPDYSLDVPVDYEFLELRMEKSVNVQINFLEQNFNLWGNHLGLVTGLGLEYVNYRFDDDVLLTGKEKTISSIPPQEGFRYDKSKLVVNYLNLPLILEYQTNRFSKSNSFHIGAGVIGGLRIGSHSKNVYDDGNDEKNKVRDDFHLNPLKLESTVHIGWGIVNLYGNYSLTSLFRDGRGPELYPFSVGLTLASW